MSPEQIYAVALQAGFPSTTAVKMVAIALRESGGNPNAFNGDSSTGDRSYGLWQINMYGNLAAERMRMLGLQSEQQLFEPAVNARAAYKIWNGNDANLARHWYIDRPVYKERYEQYLPVAQVAANAYGGNIPEQPMEEVPGSGFYIPILAAAAVIALLIATSD